MTSILGWREYFFFVRILTQLKYLSKLTPVPAESENSQNPHFFYPSSLLHGYVSLVAYRVSDTYRIRIRTGYAMDTYPPSIRIIIIFANIG